MQPDQPPEPTGWLPVLRRTAADTKEYLAEAADVAVSALVDTDALESVPLVSTAVKVLNVRDAFHKARIKRNVYQFLLALADADKPKLEDLFDALENDPQQGEDFADTLASILIEAEKPLKAKIVGCLVKAASKGNISRPDLDLACQLVYSASVPALTALPIFFAHTRGKEDFESPAVPQEALLFSLGVITRHGNTVRISGLGKLLYSYGIKEARRSRAE